MKTCLITGSTSGIGKATAIQLAKMDWNVIIHGRNEADCQNTKNEIFNLTGNNKVDYLACDLSLLKEVSKMAEKIKERFPNLNILINNAGTFSMRRQITEEGLELTWVVNYLSRFLLTNSLLDLLKKNAPARIVDIAGAYHAKGKINFDDINTAKDYSYQKANSQSKLANVLFTYQLADVLKDSGVTINTLHPGVANTGSILKAENVSGLTKFFYKLMSGLFKSPNQGAETSVYLASSPNVEGINGKYFVNKKQKQSAPKTYDKELQKKLWRFSKKMVNKI